MGTAWSIETIDSVAEMATEKVSSNNLTVENYISTENMLPERQGVELATKLPTLGNVNAFRPGDVLFSNIRTYFKKVWLAPWHGGASADVIIFRPRSNQKINNHFLYYLLSSDAFIESTVTASKGTKMPRGDKDAMRTYEFGLPPLTTQQRIAEILSTYDELIENSQRRIKILESMARGLYCEWFVYFRFPGHESIPLVPSALGDIPQGWEVKKLGKIAENFDRLRKPLSKMQRVEMQGDFPYYGAAKVFDYVNNFIFDGEYLLMAEDGSVITTERNPILQLVNEKFWPNNHTHVLQGKMPVSTHFLYLGLSQVDISPYITGSAQPKITQENMNRIPFFCGQPRVHEEFNQLVEPMIRESQLLQSQIQNLRRTRDLLLPRLLSGQINVFRQDEEGAA